MNMKVKNAKSNLLLFSTSFVVVGGENPAISYDFDFDIFLFDVTTYNEIEQSRWLKTTSLVLE